MTCELWVRGDAENAGIISVDVLVRAWNPTDPLPSLSIINTGNVGRGVFTRYSLSVGWQYDPTGWYTFPDLYLKGSCNQTIRHDCLNGGCVPSTTYNTPGLYPNLAGCQSQCGGGNCNGECVSLAELAALQQAANRAQSNCCN